MSKKGRSDGDLRPRAEAGPVPYTELTTSQEQTARQVLRLLAGMASATTQFEPYEQDLIRIDPIRHNRTILIDGARGSGKTTLLISLLDVLQRRFGRLTDSRHPSKKHDDDDWAKLLKDTTGESLIVPVSLVDLAPLPRRSSLLLLLISCLETIVARMESASHGVSSELRAQARLAPFCHDGERMLPSRERWNELAAATVQGWDDHAGKRTPPSDLESYAQEQMTAEQQRLDISNLIDRFLNALQDDFRKYLQKVSTDKQRGKSNESTLFLIAVDDADMNPGRVAELLDVLRLLGHRQLAFLLTGDSELFQDTLYKSCLIALAGERLAAATETSSMLRARAEPLAHQIYDKLVPPSHRFVIKQIPREARLAVPVLPLGKADSQTSSQLDEQKGRTLKSVLEQYTPQIGSILAHCPFLLDVLPGHMRRLQNLLLEVEGLSANHQAAIYRESELVHTMWQTISAEAGRSLARDRLGDVASDSGVLRVSLRSSIADLCLQRTSNHVLVPKSEELPVRQIYIPEFQLPEMDRLGREQALVAALTLASVTALLQEKGSVKQIESLTRAPKEYPLVQVQIALTETLTLGWPIPTQLALHEQVALVYYFAQWGLAKKDCSELVTRYLHLVCTMRKLFAAQGKTLPQVPQAKLSLAEVARQIQLSARLQKAGQTTAETSVQTWAKHGAALLCAPEYGLPAKLANELLFELRRVFGAAEWPKLCAELAQARRERVMAALPDQGDEDTQKDPSAAPLRAKAEDRILSLIDQQLPDYDFRLLVEDIAAGTIRKALHSANLTVSDATLLLLEQCSADWLRLLLDGLRTLAGQKPEDRKLAESLDPAWQATGQPQHYGFLLDAAPFARLSKESPIAVLLRLREALMSDRLPRGESLAQGRTDATELPITVSLAALPTFRRVEGQLSPLQEGILHLLWDEQLAGATALPLTSTQEWPAVSVRIDSTIDQIELPWLSALFRTFAAAGAVTETWNQAIEILRRPEHRRADSTLLDRLAFFYVRCCVAAATAAPMPTSLPERDLLYRDFGELLKQVAQTVAQSSETQQGARSGIVTAELWEEVILLAMPEAGLSFEGVRAIILFLQEQDSDHRHLRSALQRRKARLSTLIWNERDPARRTREESQAAAKRLLDYVEKIARNVGHPFQVWLDTSPKLLAMLKTF